MTNLEGHDTPVLKFQVLKTAGEVDRDTVDHISIILSIMIVL